MARFTQADIPGVWVIEPTVLGDSRGYFFESYRKEDFARHIGLINFIQNNESLSTYGVLRGLHFQIPPHEQAKLVRVVTGKVLDVVVDIHESSPTYGRHMALELSGKNKRQIFIPRGLAHGFVVLSEQAIFQYQVDSYYSREHERGIRLTTRPWPLTGDSPPPKKSSQKKTFNCPHWLN